MKAKKPKIIVVMPAYNAERTLKTIYSGIPKNLINSVIIVNDGSTDQTSSVAKKLKAKFISHSKNLGYGANQKTCYKQALKQKADYVIMLHPDGQYNPKDLPKFVKQLTDNQADLVLGSRFLNAGDKETPLYKSLSIKVITALFNLVLGTRLTEANTGYRGFSKKLLETIPFQKNGNSYIFDPQAIIQAKHFNLKITEVPVTKAYNPERIEPDFKTSVHHGFENLILLVQYLLHKLKLYQADFLISEK